jgi:hypothetical protein
VEPPANDLNRWPSRLTGARGPAGRALLHLDCQAR